MHGSNSNVIGDSKLLQKKIPHSARYNGVEARVDTGHSVTRYMKKIEEMNMNSQSRKNELFKRMKITTLAQLVLQVANISMGDDDDFPTPRTDDAMAIGGSDSESTRKTSVSSSNDDNVSVASSRYSLQSVIRGMGEVDVADDNKPKPKEETKPFIEREYQDCPYLLLDVRSVEEYDACHIIGAKNFPIAMLSRTMNCFSKDILQYRNSPGKILVLYDEDERMAVSAGTTMAQRGFDNIFVLSGGLKVLSTKLPEGMVTGSFPPTCRPPVKQRRSGGDRSARTIHNEPADPKKQRFSGDDLDRISHHLNECLVPQDTASRLSRLSSNPRKDLGSKLSTTSSSSKQRAWR